MTRKHYKAIAAAIRDSWTRDGAGDPLPQLHGVRLINLLANYLGQDNPRFDRERFVDACNPDPNA